MPGYFKFKRPFATKTKNLPVEEIKKWAEEFNQHELNYASLADYARKAKIALKEWSLIQAKIDKEKNEIKKEKLQEKLKKPKNDFMNAFDDLFSWQHPLTELLPTLKSIKEKYPEDTIDYRKLTGYIDCLESGS